MQGLIIVAFAQSYRIQITRHRWRLSVQHRTPKQHDKPLKRRFTTKGRMKCKQDLLNALIEFQNELGCLLLFSQFQAFRPLWDWSVLFCVSSLIRWRTSHCPVLKAPLAILSPKQSQTKVLTRFRLPPPKNVYPLEVARTRVARVSITVMLIHCLKSMYDRCNRAFARHREAGKLKPMPERWRVQKSQ
jgi:hypothetical protein